MKTKNRACVFLWLNKVSDPCVLYLLMAMAMMTGSQPEYRSSLVDGILLAISTHRGHNATNTAHTSGLA